VIDVDEEHSGVVVQKCRAQAELIEMRPSGGHRRGRVHAPTRG
jgi:predicted membrane GTPase involved in stress response